MAVSNPTPVFRGSIWIMEPEDARRYAEWDEGSERPPKFFNQLVLWSGVSSPGFGIRGVSTIAVVYRATHGRDRWRNEARHVPRLCTDLEAEMHGLGCALKIASDEVRRQRYLMCDERSWARNREVVIDEVTVFCRCRTTLLAIRDYVQVQTPPWTTFDRSFHYHAGRLEEMGIAITLCWVPQSGTACWNERASTLAQTLRDGVKMRERLDSQQSSLP